MNKKDNIEFKVQETVVEEPAVQEEASLKEEAADIGNIIRESLDKIDSQIRAVLDEAQMKVEG